MIRIILITLIYIPTFFSLAQDSNLPIQFDKTSYDFGDIEEANGNVAYTFMFKNTGASELSVEEVVADCGCTTPEWTQGNVKPGETGFIKAEYNPENRPGAFHKTLIVFFNNNMEPIELFIEGNVVPKLKTIEEEYPVVMGGIRVKYRNISFEKITTEKPVTKIVSVYNEMNKEAIWEDEIEAPDHISVKFSPESIPANSLGTIELTYDPRGIELLGYKGDKLEIETNEWFNSTKKFRVIAFLEEYFPPLTSEELAQAPILKIDNPTHDFGIIKEGEILTHNFVITNTGKEELNIRMTRASCGCTVSKPEKDNLDPDESSEIHVTFNSKGKSGDQEEIILVFSNDPTHPTQKLRIKGLVQSEAAH